MRVHVTVVVLLSELLSGPELLAIVYNPSLHAGPGRPLVLQVDKSARKRKKKSARLHAAAALELRHRTLSIPATSDHWLTPTPHLTAVATVMMSKSLLAVPDTTWDVRCGAAVWSRLSYAAAREPYCTASTPNTHFRSGQNRDENVKA